MTKRQIAHITIEAETPLRVGSANSDFLQDSPIQRDWNCLPMILGTSIAGVLRKDFDGNDNEIFGEDEGSKVIFSNALLIDENSRVNEGLLLEKSDFLQIFDNLPIREHTAITDKGVAKEHSKFDEEVVYKGSRFKFSMEILDSQEAFNALIELLQSPAFRLGGGSTKGFGKFKVLEIVTTNIETPQQLADYSSSLNVELTNGCRVDLLTNVQTKKYNTYTLKISPDDFFMFGSGFGDSEADQTAVVEKVIDYEKKGLSKNHILIPATSLKGALAHRTTYHYNLNNKLYIGNEEAREVIDELFGEAKNSKKEIDGAKGKVIFSDCFKLDRDESKIFDHVAIDRFTGGGIDGALFQEKTVAQSDEWNIEILIESGIDEAFIKAFEQSLDDICSGMLPLGGATTKGHGVFNGIWSKS
jgi:CRISPR/Cas system CSM-associated protein Csm3 (group 7 of RAMP superfamily)